MNIDQLEELKAELSRKLEVARKLPEKYENDTDKTLFYMARNYYSYLLRAQGYLIYLIESLNYANGC